MEIRQTFNSARVTCLGFTFAARNRCVQLAIGTLSGCGSAASSVGSYSWRAGSATWGGCCSIGNVVKRTFASVWDLHAYPIRAAEITLEILNTYVADPLIAAANLTKNYFKKHYGEVLLHIVAWSIIFALCGLLGARGLSGLKTITKPILIGLGPGFLAGILGGIIAARAGLKYDPQKGGFAEKIENASDNPFLKAAGGATYMLAAATIPYVIGAATGVFLGYKIVQHITDFPEPVPTHDERIDHLERTVHGLVTRSRSNTEERVDFAATRQVEAAFAARLRAAADVLQYGSE